MKISFLIKLTLVTFFVLMLFSCGSTKIEKESSATTIYLVRHAEKADDGTSDPPLTKVGQVRATFLSQFLQDKNISAVYSTDYKRTRETAQPLSGKLNVPITIYNPRELDAFANTLQSTKGKNIFVAGHSNSTPTLANYILDEEKFQRFDESDYNNLIIIKINGDSKSGSLIEVDP